MSLCSEAKVVGGFVDPSFEFGDSAVADLGGDVEVGLSVELGAQVLKLFFEVANRVDRLFLGVPALAHGGALGVERGEFAVERVEAFARGGVGLLLEGDLFDLELEDSALDDVDLGWHRVDLDPEFGRGFIDEVDRLVGEEAVGEVAVGEHGGRDERGVLDADTVVDLVALLQSAKDANGVLDGRLADVDLLEAPLEGGVFLDVFAVLVEGGGADHVQLAAGEHGLDHVAGVHRALGPAGTDDGVQFVDEGDDLAGRVGDLLEHGLQAFFELAAVFRAGEHGADIEGDESLAFQAFGNIAVGDATGEPFDDGGFADSWFSDEDWVVLGAAAEHLDDAADLVVAADDGVDPTLGGSRGEVLSVFLERCEFVFGVLVGDAVRSTHFAERAQEFLARHAEPVGEGEEEVLNREVVVAEFASRSIGGVDGLGEFPVHAGVVAAGRPGQTVDGLLSPLAHHRRCLAEPGEERGDDGALLRGDGDEEVVGGQLGVGEGARLVNGEGERFLGLDGPGLRVDGHVVTLPRRSKLDTERLKFS